MNLVTLERERYFVLWQSFSLFPILSSVLEGLRWGRLAKKKKNKRKACRSRWKSEESFGGRASPFSHPWFLTEFSNPGIEFYGFSILCGPRGGVAGRVVR